MSLESVHPSVGRRSPDAPTAHRVPSPTLDTTQDEDVESTAPSSPCSVYRDDDSTPPLPAAVNTPHLCSTHPFTAYGHLTTRTVTEFRITDNSHSHSNPAQRKKGGCKSVQLTVHIPAQSQCQSVSYGVAAKCDVRKSFSNRSFSQYYDRGQYAVVPVTQHCDVVVVVEEAQRGRDGKHFVAMERTCVPPWAVDDKRRHPLLAFAADAVYRVSVLTGPDAAKASVEVKCQFTHGSVTVSNKQAAVAAVESRKRQREVKVEAEAVDQKDVKIEDDNELPAQTAVKRRRNRTSNTIQRVDSADSFDSTNTIPDIASPASPFSTTDSLSSSPSYYPSSPFTASTASPSPPGSPSPFAFHLEPPSGCQLVDDVELRSGGALLDVPSGVCGLVLPSPALAPLPVWPVTAGLGGVGGSRLLSPYPLLFSPWRGGAAWLAEVDEFVL